MTPDRRQFLDKLALGAVAVGGAAMGLAALPRELSASPSYRTSEYDVRWPARLTGRVRAVFDVPEVESAYGVWRASLWARQFESEIGIPAAQLSTALVLRHNAIVLAMQQSFWDKYSLADISKATHPLTGEPTKRNPALLSAADGTPAPYDSFALQPFMARGGVILACNLALQDLIAVVAKTDSVSAEVARERAIAGLVPGVILQASGVFAVLLAQHEKQAMYIRAS